MLIVVATFVLVLAIVLGLYALLIARPDAKAHAELQARMAPKAPKRKRRLVVAPEDDQAEPSPALKVLRRLAAPIQRSLERAGLRMTVPVFVMLSVWAGALPFVLVWMGTGYAQLGALGLVGSAIPYTVVAVLGRRRSWRFEEQFPEAVDLVSRALRAGHALPTALGMVASEVPDPVGAEFKTLYDQQNFGMSLPDALRAFAGRVPVLDARFFVTAVLIQRESGGNLAGVLDNLGAVIRERFKVKRQVRVISAHGRITAAFLSALPPLLAFLFTLWAPDGMLLLFRDPIGRWMVAAAIILQIIGMAAMKKIVKVEV